MFIYFSIQNQNDDFHYWLNALRNTDGHIYISPLLSLHVYTCTLWQGNMNLYKLQLSYANTQNLWFRSIYYPQWWVHHNWWGTSEYKYTFFTSHTHTHTHTHTHSHTSLKYTHTHPPKHTHTHTHTHVQASWKSDKNRLTTVPNYWHCNQNS